MATVLIFGAGMVARPIIRYLLDQPDIRVTVATEFVHEAEALIDGHPAGHAKTIDVRDRDQVASEIRTADVAVSLVPYAFHALIAEVCVEHGKHLVTTSYAGEPMRDLDGAAKGAGILVLNECGLDPGIDHMSAMRIIHDVRARGGKVESFRSTTGALPAHDSSNNPFGYKFTWSPRGVLLASKNAAKWLEDGEEINVPGERLFEHYNIVDVPGVGSFENYPNRDSLSYRDAYELQHAHTVYRGTFRMVGWCETVRGIVTLGWLGEEPVDGFSGRTYGDLTRYFVKASPGDDTAQKTAGFLGLAPYSAVIKRMEWLGLFGDTPLPENRDNPLDYLNVLMLDRMSPDRNDRDMVVMHHEFVAGFPGGGKEHITSTLVEYGVPGGDSAVARTVSLPAAFAVRMLLDGTITETGVHIPVTPGIYKPILDELAANNMVFRETARDA
jgi:saccharopine dehydrogenase-like NADP-dependent oxidoreductase